VNLKPFLRLSLPCTLLGLALASHATPAAVRFDTVPRAGQHQRQLMDVRAVMTMKLEPGPAASPEERAKLEQAGDFMSRNGPIKMAMQMQETLKVGAADAKGWLPVTVDLKSLSGSMEAGGKTVPLPRAGAGDIRVSGRFNPKDFGFEVQMVDGGPAGMAEVMTQRGRSLLGDALQIHKALAERPLKIGESVEVPYNVALPMPMPGGAGEMQSKIRYTLNRLDKGVAYFDLNLVMDMDVNTTLPPPARAASAAADAASQAASAPDAASTLNTADAPARTLQMKIKATGSGSSSLRLSDRLPLSSQMKMVMKMVADGPDNTRMTMDMDMTLQSRGESLARGTAAKRKKP